MSLDRSTRARLTTAFVLLLVLASGVVLGMALDRQLEARGVRGEESWRPQGRSGGEGRARGFDSWGGDSLRDSAQSRDPAQRRPSLMVEQVGLSDEQREKVDSIIQYYRGQMRTLHTEFNESYTTHFNEITQKTRDEIKAILTVEQQVAYDSLLVEWDRRRESRSRDSISNIGGGRNGR